MASAVDTTTVVPPLMVPSIGGDKSFIPPDEVKPPVELCVNPLYLFLGAAVVGVGVTLWAMKGK